MAAQEAAAATVRSSHINLASSFSSERINGHSAHAGAATSNDLRRPEDGLPSASWGIGREAMRARVDAAMLGPVKQQPRRTEIPRAITDEADIDTDTAQADNTSVRMMRKASTDSGRSVGKSLRRWAAAVVRGAKVSVPVVGSTAKQQYMPLGDDPWSGRAAAALEIDDGEDVRRAHRALMQTQQQREVVETTGPAPLLIDTPAQVNRPAVRTRRALTIATPQNHDLRLTVGSSKDDSTPRSAPSTGVLSTASMSPASMSLLALYPDLTNHPDFDGRKLGKMNVYAHVQVSDD
ncbi:hypothetical protein PYCC9005_004068 [Savitreella phatthalungensis]